MRFWRKSTLACLLAFAVSASAVAQTAPADDEDTQQWNDVQVTIPVHPKVDLAILTTFRFGQNVSRLTEGRVGGGVIFKLNKGFTISPGYLYIESRNTAGAFRTEHRYSIRSTYKFPVKKFGLSHRSQYEYRVRGSGNSWRYRPSLTFEKVLPDKLIGKAKLLVTEELFYVSTTGKFSRNRISVGVNKEISKHLTLELYYLRQNDGFSHPGDLNVVGTSWKIRL